MSGFKNSKNVWGKQNWGSFKEKSEVKNRNGSRQDKLFGNSSLAKGPFGSTSNFGKNPGREEETKKHLNTFFSFELCDSSSSGSSSSSTPTSTPSTTRRTPSSPIIGFGREPKRYKWTANGVLLSASSKHINLGEMVENVFREEIGKMAESLQERATYSL